MDGPDHWASHRNLCQLEGDGEGVAHDAGTDLNQHELEARERPVCHRLSAVAPRSVHVPPALSCSWVKFTRQKGR